MIRLIACDLDGTLLDPSGALPQGIFETIEKLYKRGILFCPASGRQAVALEKMFSPVADKILIMAENGAIVWRGGKTLYCDSIPAERVGDALAAVKTLRRAHALLCTPGCAYFEDDVQPFVTYVAASYLHNARGDFAEIAAENPVCKIAVFDECGPENDGMRVLPSLLPDLRIIQSGGNWLDISAPTSNKGRAMQFMQKMLGVSPAECAAFGDHMNDLEMLLACKYAYAPENAYEGVKARIAGRVPSNAENGVPRALGAIAEGKFGGDLPQEIR